MNGNSIKDVAKRAGVSIATVSRVINGTANVDKMKTEAVKEAMAFYHYVPNQFGRGLVKQKNEMIGVYFPYSGRSLFDNLFYMELLRGIDAALAKERYSLLLINENGGQNAESFMQYVRKQSVDGLLLNGMTEEMASNPELIELIENRYPLVYIGKQIHENSMNVYARYEEYMTDMMNIFFENGHRNLLVLLEDRKRNVSLFENLKEKFLMDKSDMVIKTEIVCGHENELSINHRLESFLLQEKGSAIFACDMQNAFSVINFCTKHGLKIPENVSIIAAEHKLGGGESLFPQISSFYVPAKEMGCCAADMLLRCLKGEKISEKCKEFESVYKDRGSVKKVK